MKVAIVPGHTLTGKGTGAVGILNESKENRTLADLVVKWLKQGGAEVIYGKVDNSSNYLAEQVAIANKQKVDVAVQIHFNAGGGTGTETLYRSASGKVFASRVNSNLASVFRNRGVKHDINDVGRKLYWFSNTNAPAILIEVCFVDTKADADLYNKNKDKIAKLIAEGILGKTITGSSSSGGGSTNYTVRVNTDSLNVRTGPGTDYKISDSVKKGDVYTIVEEKNGWGKLKSGVGWIKLSYTVKL